MPTFVNGFSALGASTVIGHLVTQAPKYVPMGTLQTTGTPEVQTWGIGKQNTSNLPTPQTYTATVNATTQTINIAGDSQPFDITIEQLSYTVTGVQIVTSANVPVLEVDLTSSALYPYDGEFTIKGPSSISFASAESFY